MRGARLALLRLTLAAAALATGWAFWVHPEARRAAALRAAVEAARGRISAAGRAGGEAAGDLGALEVEAARLRARLLPGRDATPLLARLAAAAARHGLRPVALRPLPPPPGADGERPAGLARVPVELALRGSYPATVRFLASLRDGPFLVRVEALRLAPEEGGPGALRVTLTLAGYAREEVP